MSYIGLLPSTDVVRQEPLPQLFRQLQSHALFSIADGCRAAWAAKSRENVGSVLFEPVGDAAPRLFYVFCFRRRYFTHVRSPTEGARLFALLALRNRSTGSKVLTSSIENEGDH